MEKVTLNIDYIRIRETNSNRIYYGCKQEWYKRSWQRRAGCGPTTATNLIIYLTNSIAESNDNTKQNSIYLMEEMWNYVTPTIMGVNTTKIFYEGLLDYSVKNKLNLAYKYMDIPFERKNKPSLTEALHFICDSLHQNVPVAFLNLSSGEEKALEDWHWVTIISISLKDKGRAMVEIADGGKIKKIDFSLWFLTTKLGGGLVSFLFMD